MESKFLAVLEREQPGLEEVVVGIILVDDGKTKWVDVDGEHDFSGIAPDESLFDTLQSSVEQGDRRMLVVPAVHFEDVRKAMRRSVRARAVAMA